MMLKRIFRIGLVASLVLVLFFIAGILVVRSHAVHRYLLANIVENAQKAIGGRVELGDFALHLSGPRVDLYRIVIHGTEGDPHAPLLRADHLGVGVRAISLWGRRIGLQEIVVDHPVVHLVVDERGHNNLPQTPSAAPGSTPVNIFDLAVRHVLLNRGEIDYNDRQTPLEAEVRDLQAQVAFSSSKRQYDGRLSYREGRLRFGDYNPLQHDLDAQFGAGPSGLALNSLRLSSGASRITAQAHLENYSNPTVDGSYDVLLATGDLRNLFKNNVLPASEVSTKGTVHYGSSPSQAVLDGLSIRGELGSPALAMDFPQAHASVRALKGQYQLQGGTLEVRNVEMDILGGHLGAEFTMRHLAGNPEARVAGTIRGLSLPDALAALQTRPQGNLRITGRMDGKADATWRGSMEDLQVRSDATLAASTPAPGSAGAGTGTNPIPLNAAVHLAYDGRTDVLSLHETQLRTPHAAVNLDGSLGNRSKLGIHAKSDDLHELDVLLLAVRMATVPRKPAVSKGRAPLGPTPPPQLFGLGGSASFAGQVQGPLQRFRVTGHLSGANLRYQSTSLPSLASNVDLSSSGLALYQGDLQTSARGRVRFDVAVGLKDWAYTPKSPINLRISANNVPVADVQRVASLHYPISGLLSVDVSAQGSQTNPVGQGSVQLSQARAWGEPIEGLAIRFQGAESTVHSTLDLRTPAGSGRVRLSYSPNDEGYDVQLDVPGIRLGQLESVRARNLAVAGVLTASARGRGTLKSPQLEASVEVPGLQVQEQKLDGLKIQAGIAQQRATFSLDSRVEGAYLQARGAVSLNADYDSTVNIDTRRVELGPLLASYLPEHGSELRGQTEVHGWLKGPLKYPERVEAHIDIPTLSLGYQSVQVASASPIRIDYRAATLSLERAELKGTDTDLQLQAVVPMGADGALRASATGTVDLHLAQLLDPDVDSSGQVKLDAGVQGTRARPEVYGSVRVVDAAFRAPGAPLGVEKLNAELQAQKGRVEIKSFVAQTGGGTVTAQGTAIYQPAVRFNIGLSAKQVRLRYPEGVRAVLDSDLTLNGTPASSSLNGKVLIDHVSFTKAFDLATFADQFSGPSSPPTEGFADNLKLNLALKSSGDMGLSSAELSVQGSVDLRVVGTAADPVILGRTNIAGGEMFFNDRRYELQNGVIEFVNPVRTEPVVNLLVTTTADQFNISLNFVGPLDRLRTTYTSDPPLPPVDIINLLVTGRTTEAASASPTTPQSVLAGQLAGQVSSRIGKMVGFSSLKIDPQMGGNGSNPGARLAIQERVTKNLFFTFATDVTTTQGVAVQVEYQVTPKYSLSTVRDQNGGYSLQVKMHKRF
jgi:translocation and assembly module TamB